MERDVRGFTSDTISFANYLRFRLPRGRNLFFVRGVKGAGRERALNGMSAVYTSDGISFTNFCCFVSLEGGTYFMS